jgi:hypothetical protein
VAVSFIGGGKRSARNNYRPVASHRQTLSRNKETTYIQQYNNGEQGKFTKKNTHVHNIISITNIKFT